MGLIIHSKNITIMKKKNDFGMWLFSDGVMKILNYLAVILIIIWFGYHIARFIFRF